MRRAAIAIADLPRPCLLCGGRGHRAGGHDQQAYNPSFHGFILLHFI
jgi:hypothetical protein